MMINAPDSLAFSGFNRQIQELRQQLDRSAIEMVTGRAQDQRAAARGDNGLLLEAQAQLEASEPQLARLSVIEGRYRTSALAFETIRELTSGLITTVQSAGNATTGIEASTYAASEARTTLAGLTAAFETRYAGRPLFGGDLGNGDVMADALSFVAALETELAGLNTPAALRAGIDDFFAPGGTFETSIYSGGDRLGDVRLENGRTIEATITADDDAFRQLLKGFAMATMNEELAFADRPGFLREAGEVLSGAKDRLIAIEAATGLALNAVDRAKTQQQQVLLDAQRTLETLIGRDAFEAASETQSLETRLQAAYTVTTRISNLSLANFL